MSRISARNKLGALKPVDGGRPLIARLLVYAPLEVDLAGASFPSLFSNSLHGADLSAFAL
jgi:hypothetical protein